MTSICFVHIQEICINYIYARLIGAILLNTVKFLPKHKNNCYLIW
jgi:hypothetical protein